MNNKLLLGLLCFSLISVVVRANEIEVPEEELARETTLPIFDKRQIVLNRNVVTEQRFEIGGGFGLEMNEPYYNDYMFNLQGTYNLSDRSAINVLLLFWMDGLSNYGEQLKAGRPTATPPVQSFDAMKAPHPKWGMFANYEFIAYYGKISISKLGVMNLNTFGIAGLGYINMDSLSSPALNLGVGQNFFFTKNFGLRFDLRYLIFQGPDATSKPLRSVGTTIDPTPDPNSFDERIHYNGQISLSAIFLL